MTNCLGNYNNGVVKAFDNWNYLYLRFVDKLARLLEDLNENYVSNINKNMKWEHLNEYLPPYFFPRDLESVFEARCKLEERENTDSFDENLKGFTAILSSAVVEMSQLCSSKFHSVS